jgi:endonuclease/exonuclease/phosphatase family metal-dependent hydrolase
VTPSRQQRLRQLRHLRRAAGALLAAAVICLPARARAQAGQTSVDILTFNIRHGLGQDGEHVWPNRREIVVSLLRDQAADIVGLQEVLHFQLQELRAALPGYRAVGVGRDDGATAGEYAPLLIDTMRFVVLDEGTFWLSDTPTVPGSTHWGNGITRIVSWARLADRRTGDTLRVYNAHWDHESQPSRERSAALMLARMAQDGSPSDALLATGDFNAGESNAAFRALVGGSAPSLRDSYRVLHPTDSIVGTFNGFRGDSLGEKIDAVLVGRTWRVEAAAIDRRRVRGLWPSDHFPVSARVRKQ